MRFCLLLTLFFLAVTVGCDESLTTRCKELSAKHEGKAKTEWKRDYTLLKTDTFYSKKLDACIHTEVAEVGVYTEIRDLSHSVMRDDGDFNVLLLCDKDGADSVRLDKLNQFRGRVFAVPYAEWLDDGFGGPPRTLKTPATPYTREQCRKVFEKWLSDLRP